MANKLLELRKAAGLTQAQLAAESRVSQASINYIEKGKRGAKGKVGARLASYFKVQLADLQPDIYHAPVMGHVGAGAVVTLPPDMSFERPLYYVACPPRLRPDNVVAVEVKGDSMWPAMNEGDLLFYERGHEGVASEAVNQTCVCEDTEGNVWVKRIEAGKDGTFDLISLNPAHGRMFNVALRYASPVLLHWPLALVERVEG